jgi:hypothetical protein
MARCFVFEVKQVYEEFYRFYQGRRKVLLGKIEMSDQQPFSLDHRLMRITKDNAQ